MSFLLVLYLVKLIVLDKSKLVFELTSSGIRAEVQTQRRKEEVRGELSWELFQRFLDEQIMSSFFENPKYQAEIDEVFKGRKKLADADFWSEFWNDFAPQLLASYLTKRLAEREEGAHVLDAVSNVADEEEKLEEDPLEPEQPKNEGDESQFSNLSSSGSKTEEVDCPCFCATLPLPLTVGATGSMSSLATTASIFQIHPTTRETDEIGAKSAEQESPNSQFLVRTKKNNEEKNHELVLEFGEDSSQTNCWETFQESQATCTSQETRRIDLESSSNTIAVASPENWPDFGNFVRRDLSLIAWIFCVGKVHWSPMDVLELEARQKNSRARAFYDLKFGGEFTTNQFRDIVWDDFMDDFACRRVQALRAKLFEQGGTMNDL